MHKIYEYAKIVNQRASKKNGLYRKPYEEIADGVVWEWENKHQFESEEDHLEHIELYSKLRGSYHAFLDFKKHYKSWLYKQKAQ